MWGAELGWGVELGCVSSVGIPHVCVGLGGAESHHVWGHDGKERWTTSQLVFVMIGRGIGNPPVFLPVELGSFGASMAGLRTRTCIQLPHC